MQGFEPWLSGDSFPESPVHFARPQRNRRVPETTTFMRDASLHTR